jgi:serralysin
MRFLYGFSGPDLLEARLYDNYTMYGRAGADKLYGSVFWDSLNGGGGNDQIYGYGGADRIDAGAGFDLVRGGSGNDRIIGGLGDDELYGDDGHDTLKGGSGLDDLFGGAGEDIVDGQGGSDYLEGNAGEDIFIYKLGYGFDIVGDFTFDTDQIYVDVRGIRSFQDLKLQMHADGADTVIDFGGADSLVIANTRPNQFEPIDFVIF